jgi:hypothetical protein
MKMTSWRVKDEIRVMCTEQSEKAKRKRNNIHYAIKLAIGFSIMIAALAFL